MTDSVLKDKAECTYCKKKGHLEQACIIKDKSTGPRSLDSSLKSDRNTSDATQQDLVLDSGSTDHVVVNKNWFKSLRELDVAVCRQRRTEILRSRTKTLKTFLKLNIDNPQIKLNLVFIYSDINCC